MDHIACVQSSVDSFINHHGRSILGTLDSDVVIDIAIHTRTDAVLEVISIGNKNGHVFRYTFNEFGEPSLNKKIDMPHSKLIDYLRMQDISVLGQIQSSLMLGNVSNRLRKVNSLPRVNFFSENTLTFSNYSKAVH